MDGNYLLDAISSDSFIGVGNGKDLTGRWERHRRSHRSSIAITTRMIVSTMCCHLANMEQQAVTRRSGSSQYLRWVSIFTAAVRPRYAQWTIRAASRTCCGGWCCRSRRPLPTRYLSLLCVAESFPPAVTYYRCFLPTLWLSLSCLLPVQLCFKHSIAISINSSAFNDCRSSHRLWIGGRPALIQAVRLVWPATAVLQQYRFISTSDEAGNAGDDCWCCAGDNHNDDITVDVDSGGQSFKQSSQGLVHVRVSRSADPTTLLSSSPEPPSTSEQRPHCCRFCYYFSRR